MAQTIENAALKKQFESLQEQQQKKLMIRKQKQEEKKKQKTPPGKTSAASVKSSASFGIDDDLDLKLADPPVPSNAIYNEELVDHLNDQMREMKDETGRLYKLLSERDFELRQLRKKLEDSKLLEGTAIGSDAAATKIVDLSKKIRQLTTELESEKTKNKQLQRKILEQEAKGTPRPSENKTTNNSARGDGETKDPEVTIKNLQEKLRQAEMKVSEFRNGNVTLKQELKMAQKIIEQEVGEGATVQSLTTGSGPGWRGRAQQVITLQKKVNDLRAQLDLKPPATSSTARDVDDLEAEFMGSAVSVRGSNRRDDRQKNEIRRIERERKEQQEKLVAEKKALETDYDALKTKFESSKARNKVLSNDLKSLKQEMQKLLTKGTHDDELIQALFKQLSGLKQQLEQQHSQENQHRAEHDDAVKQLAMRTQHDSNIVGQLKAIVAEREAKVKALEEEIQQLRLSTFQKVQAFAGERQVSDVGTSALNSARTLMMEDCGSLTPQLQSRSSSRNHTPYLPQEHNQPSHTPPPPGSSHSSRPSSRHQPPGVDTFVQEELTREVTEYKSMCQAISVERDKLGELVGVLQARVDETTAQITESQAEVAAAKRKCVQLEKQLGKLKMEQHGHSGGHSGVGGKRGMGSKVSLSMDEGGLSAEDQLEEMETNLLIQRDENEALKAALQSTLKAKEEDLKLYNQMIEDTKKIFLQGLRQYRDKAK